MARYRNSLVVGTLVACAVCASAVADESGLPADDAPGEEQTLPSLDSISLDANGIRFQALSIEPRAAAAPPRRPGGAMRNLGAREDIVWGLGPKVVRPVRSEDALDSGAWSAGVASVAFAVEGVRMYGALASERCALAGELDRGNANGFLIQPFVNYNLADGWYLASTPVIRADWTAAGGRKWTVPVGASIGRLARLGDMPISVRAGFYQNVERPDGEPEWALRLEMRLTFSP
jgi:hypothetical protein